MNGASISDWDLFQYPGTGGSVTQPIALDQQVAALINGGQLSNGDLLARISDLNPKLATVTKGGAPNNSNRKLLTSYFEQLNILLLNGFTAAEPTIMRIYDSYIYMKLFLYVPANTLSGTLVATLPFACLRTVSANLYALNGITVAGAAAYYSASAQPITTNILDISIVAPYV